MRTTACFFSAEVGAWECVIAFGRLSECFLCRSKSWSIGLLLELQHKFPSVCVKRTYTWLSVLCCDILANIPAVLLVFLYYYYHNIYYYNVRHTINNGGDRALL